MVAPPTLSALFFVDASRRTSTLLYDCRVLLCSKGVNLQGAIPCNKNRILSTNLQKIVIDVKREEASCKCC